MYTSGEGVKYMCDKILPLRRAVLNTNFNRRRGPRGCGLRVRIAKQTIFLSLLWLVGMPQRFFFFFLKKLPYGCS